MPREYIGERLRRIRKAAGLTQMELARQLGISWRNIQDWESDRTAVDTFKAAALLAAAEKIASQGKGKKAKRKRGKR